MELNGARTVIFGATGALGGLIANNLAAQGASLVVSGRDAERLSALAGQTAAVSGVPADLTDPAEAARVVEEGVGALGGLDLLVYAAGVVAFGPAKELGQPVLQELTAVNLSAPIIATSAALSEMTEGATIVNLTGIVAEMPTAGMAAYSATKAGLAGFNAAAAREARRAKIRILDARPPHLETGLAERAIAGDTPKLPPGHSPEAAVQMIADAIADDGVREIDWTF